jgi:hypothetical protein
MIKIQANGNMSIKSRSLTRWAMTSQSLPVRKVWDFNCARNSLWLYISPLTWTEHKKKNHQGFHFQIAFIWIKKLFSQENKKKCKKKTIEPVVKCTNGNEIWQENHRWNGHEKNKEREIERKRGNIRWQQQSCLDCKEAGLQKQGLQ